MAADPSPGAAPSDLSFGPASGSTWTASAECIVLQRIGTAADTLITTYPGVPNPQTTFTVGQGTDRLYSGDLKQDFAAGPKLGLQRHDGSGLDWEISYFQIDGWNSSASVISGVDTTPVFVAPGGFVQTTDSATQSMCWSYATRLYNGEVNAHWDLCPRVSMLGGFRWLCLREELLGTIPDPQRKTPFWDTTTHNNLFGFQLGEDWKIFSGEAFTLDGLVKAGVFDNVAHENTGVSIFRHVFWESDNTNQAAFLGELELQCKYQLTSRLVLKLGYEAMWLQGVATAPGQLNETQSQVTVVNNQVQSVKVNSLGLNCNSGVFYHGVTAGTEYVF
jgi:hypothetical protein